MTTSSGSYAVTKSRALASADSMSSRRSRDGPGRFSSGLCDIQQRASVAMRTGASSLGQMKDVEKGFAHLGRTLGDAGPGDAAVGAQEHYGIGVGVEPRLQCTGAITDDDDVGVVVSRPVQLRHGTCGNKLAPNAFQRSNTWSPSKARKLLLQHSTAKPVP